MSFSHLLNVPRFTGHLITNIPQSMRLLIIIVQKDLPSMVKRHLLED